MNCKFFNTLHLIRNLQYTHACMIINLNDDKYVEVQVVDKDTMSDRMGAGSA